MNETGRQNFYWFWNTNQKPVDKWVLDTGNSSAETHLINSKSRKIAFTHFSWGMLPNVRIVSGNIAVVVRGLFRLIRHLKIKPEEQARFWSFKWTHYNDVIMGAMASRITCVSVVCSNVCSGAHQRKHQSSSSLAVVRGIHRWLVNSSHKGPVTRKMLPFNDIIMFECITPRNGAMVLSSIFE